MSVPGTWRTACDVALQDVNTAEKNRLIASAMDALHARLDELDSCRLELLEERLAISEAFRNLDAARRESDRSASRSHQL